MKKYFKSIGGLIFFLLFLLSFTHPAQALLVAIRCTTGTNNTIKNSAGQPLAQASFVQIIESTDGTADYPLKDGSPGGDTVKDFGTLQSTGNFEDSAEMAVGKYVYIRAWESWNGTGLPHGKYGTSAPALIPNQFGFVYQPASFLTNVDIFNVTVNTPSVTGIYLSGSETNFDSDLPNRNPYTITWSKLISSADPNKWEIKFSSNNGAIYSDITLIPPSPVSGTTYSTSWPLPSDVNSKDCKIRLQALDAAVVVRAANESNSTFTVDNTPPDAPTGLTVTPYQQWTRIDSYDLSWTIPSDLSGILDSRYKVGSVPNGDLNGARGGVSSASGTFSGSPHVITTSGKYYVHVWLRDMALNIDFNNRATSSDALWYDITPPDFAAGSVAPNKTITSPTSESTFTFLWLAASDAHSDMRPETADTHPYYYLFNNISNYPAFEYPSYNESGTWCEVRKNGAGVGVTTATVNVPPNTELTWYMHVVAQDNVIEPIGNLAYKVSAPIEVDTKHPSVVNFSPQGSSVLPVTTDIVIRFDDSMMTDSLQVSISPAVTLETPSWSTNSDTMTITHSPFSYARTYTVTIEAAKDKVGLDLIDTKTFSFTTGIPSLPSPVTDIRALADPNTGEITLKWTNPAENYTGGLAVYTTSFEAWDAITKDSAVSDPENFKEQDIPASGNEDPGNPNGTKYVFSGLSTAETYYFKVFSYVDAPGGGRFFNPAGEKVAALPMKGGGIIGKASGPISIPIGTKNGLGINTFSIPFDEISANFPRTAKEFVEAVNKKADAKVVTVFGYWDNENKKFVGGKISYSDNEPVKAGDDDLNTIALQKGINYQVSVFGIEEGKPVYIKIEGEREFREFKEE